MSNKIREQIEEIITMQLTWCMNGNKELIQNDIEAVCMQLESWHLEEMKKVLKKLIDSSIIAFDNETESAMCFVNSSLIVKAIKDLEKGKDDE